MKPKNVIITLLLVVAAVASLIIRFRNNPQGRELFNRHPAQLIYTSHARCRMSCRHISEQDIQDVMDNGIINLAKSNRAARPCPTYALQGFTHDQESVRIIFAQCGTQTKVITCYNLKEEFECHCPGDENKN